MLRPQHTESRMIAEEILAKIAKLERYVSSYDDDYARRQYEADLWILKYAARTVLESLDDLSEKA